MTPYPPLGCVWFGLSGLAMLGANAYYLRAYRELIPYGREFVRASGVEAWSLLLWPTLIGTLLVLVTTTHLLRQAGTTPRFGRHLLMLLVVAYVTAAFEALVMAFMLPIPYADLLINRALTFGSVLAVLLVIVAIGQRWMAESGRG